MKKIALIYRNRENMDAIYHLEEEIEGIFGRYASIDNYYVNELGEEVRINADVYVLVDRSVLAHLRTHTSSFKNIVILTRSIRKENLSKIMKIPKNEDVLIVNDTLERAIETATMLYELGIGHLNFVVYNQDEDDGRYDNIRYAIVPNEPQLVPDKIENVINVGYRKIGFDTMVQIKNALKLNNEDVDLSLLQYISTIIEPQQDLSSSYVGSFLKNSMLNEYLYDSPFALILVNNEGEIIYSNRRAKEFFGSSHRGPGGYNVNCLDRDLLKAIEKEDDILKKAIAIDGRNYILDKVSLWTSNMQIGYYVTLQDEVNIKDMETSLNKKLIEKGFFARHTFSDIKRNSDVMKESVDLSKKAALTEYTILICGESGTGKELFAQSIHNYSSRKDMPFIGVNCAAIPETLLESELFGYEEGAFTGASKKGKIGYFEQANRGTIFLDEIGDISPALQARLLRVLQERQIMRIGSDRIIDVDVRIIAATNKDLIKEVEKGRFRGDLYYRLNALQIMIPPLRERKEDILLLFKEFMKEDYLRVGRREKELLENYQWPGNVRELENCALYYKTLGKLPEQFKDKGNFDKGVSDEDLQYRFKSSVLKILMKYNTLGHGVGRMAVLEYLRREGEDVSDLSLRNILSQLQQEGLIRIGKGRQGMKITDKGIEKILR